MEALIDWLSFTVKQYEGKEATPQSVIKDILGLDIGMFQLTKGGYGYRKKYFYNNIKVYFDGREDMGVHVLISGNGVRFLETTPGFQWTDFLYLLINWFNVKITRLVVAVDKTEGILDLAYIEEKIRKAHVVSKWRAARPLLDYNLATGCYEGYTIYCSSSSKGTGDAGNNIKKLIDTFGFVYDAKQDIYISKVDAWQRYAGYHRIIDEVSAVPAGMVIDCEPIAFEYNNKTYMIKMWKGQYDLSIGSEIGIYEKLGEDPILRTTIWKCAENEDMLQMSYSLKKNGTEVFSREGKHWWLTGFKPGEFSNPGDLTMDISITFDDQHSGMRDAFIGDPNNPSKGRLEKLGYSYSVDGNTVKFSFGTPKTQQPWSYNTILNSATQVKNYGLVKAYNAAKSAVGVNDNSPSSINKILDKILGVNFFFK